MYIEYTAATLGELIQKASVVSPEQFIRQPVKEAGVWTCVIIRKLLKLEK
jgi:hypothetical protein